MAQDPTLQPLPQSPNQRRIEWVDVARGIGIWLVVVGHTFRGLVNARLVPRTEGVLFLDSWIYAFHMPLFFALAGLFAGQLTRKGWAAFLKDRAGGLAYPYLVWSLIQTTTQILLSGQTNNQSTASDLLRIPYEPIMQFWFLYALLLISVFYYTAARLRVAPAIILLAAALLLFSPDFGITAFWSVLGEAKRNLFYYALGAVAGGPLTRWTPGRLPSLLTAGAGFVGVTLAVWVNLAPRGTLGAPAVALVGLISTAALSNGLADLKGLRFLHGWGLASLQIYVAHTLASAGFRIALQRILKIDNPELHVIGGIVAGMALPLLLMGLCNRLGFRYAFSLKLAKSTQGKPVLGTQPVA